MTEELLTEYAVPIVSFFLTVVLIWGGVKAKLENIPKMFSLEIEKLEVTLDAIKVTLLTLEKTMHRRADASEVSCKEDIKRVELAISDAHHRIDKMRDKS